jgi:TPP-dependent pyruvate/acetoin dehydrogenase alpha subunit
MTERMTATLEPVQTAPAAPATARRMFERLHWIRLVEEMIARRYGGAGDVQDMRCPIHLSSGQEGAAVGVCDVLEDSDLLFSTHRCHAHYLAKGGALQPMLDEIHGKASGCVGGRGGSMHLMDESVGMFASVPIVSSAIPLAAGAALTFALDGLPHIAAAFFGDAAIEGGVWHETANFARMQNLPILFVCENNLYSIFTPLRRRQPDDNLGRLAAAFGIPALRADGNDVEVVRANARAAVDHIRQGNGPVFLQIDTYRYREHCGPNDDDHIGYRPDGELAAWRRHDPVTSYRDTLLARGIITDADVQALQQAQTAALVSGFAAALAAPLPEAHTAGDFVYA